MGQSSRMAAVQSPVIPVVGDLIRAHPGTISLGQGVVHYGPPPEATEAYAAFRADPENHKYKPVVGIPPLVEAIEGKLARENHIRVGRDARVVVTAGGNMAFNNALLAVADPGDEIVLLTPYYFNHEMAVTIAGCRPVLVPTDEAYQPDVQRIADAITPRTRAVVTISPNNPTGAVYPEATLRHINRLCAERGVYHVHDEAYEDFVYDDAAQRTATPPSLITRSSSLITPSHFSPGSLDGANEHTISLFSLSKSYGFASWRIGYMVVPAHLFEAVRKVQDTILICPPVVSQYAAVGALAAGSAYVRPHVAEIARTRRIVRDVLRGLEADGLIDLPPADGAFYFLPRVNAPLDPMALVERLVREHAVAVIPGTTFGLTEGCALRVAYGALQTETAAEGIGRFAEGIRAIAKRP